MKPYLFVLTIVLVMSIIGCKRNQPVLRVNLDHTLHHTGNTSGSTVVGLTSAECQQLGGHVEENRTCGGDNKQCRTNTVSSTGTVTSNTLCINEK